jgi:hypothetical protein
MQLPENMSQKEYVKRRLIDQLNWYDAKSKFNQSRYKLLKSLEMGFSVSIPILTAISTANKIQWIAYLIGILGGMIALFAGLQSINRYQENWVKYRIAAENLKRERIFYVTKKGPYLNKTDPNEIFSVLIERVENILSIEISDWGKYVGQEGPKK